jgi:transcriptional regulator with XRE-family HTH domain
MARYDTRPIAARFARRLRAARAASGRTQDRLARRSGLHRTEISKLDRGLTDPRLSTIVRLARSLGVPTSALVEDYEEG